jgi:hypothetical protein
VTLAVRLPVRVAEGRSDSGVSALREKGITFSVRKQPGGTYVLDFFDQPLRDLSILKGLLTPLPDLKLVKLSISSDAVTDFSPLRGMPLERLYLNHCTHLRDLSPLRSGPQ